MGYGNDIVVPENIFPARHDSIGVMSKYWHHVAPKTRGGPAIRLQKKRVRGYTYWYLVESKRVNGKPRTVWQHYLGKAEDI